MSLSEQGAAGVKDTAAAVIIALTTEMLLVGSMSQAFRDGVTELHVTIPKLNNEYQRNYMSKLMAFSADELQKRLNSCIAEYEMNPKTAAARLGFEYEGEEK
jgi:hypothetical protein